MKGRFALLMALAAMGLHAQAQGPGQVTAPGQAGLQAQRAAPVQATPVGLWRTFDERSGQAKALVRIEERDGTLVGRIERLLADPADATCQACTGELKGRPVVGLTILQGLRRDGEVWSGGDVLDPNDGRFYKAQVRVAEAGERLQLRGYLGVPSLGRTQTWRRER